MNQSSYIAAFLLAGFVLYLAANNRLSAYAAVLWGEVPSSGTGSTTSTNSSGTSVPNVTIGPFTGPASGKTNSSGQQIPQINLGIQSITNLLNGLGTIGGWLGL